MRSTLVSVFLLALCSVPGVAAPAPARHLPAPEDVSPRRRQVLKSRMGQHATSMQNLVRAVVLLDRPTIKVLADQIASEKTFAADATSDLTIPPQVTGEGEKFAA